MRGLTLAMVLLVAATPDAGAVDPKASTILGAGAMSCGAWTANRRSYVDGKPITAGSLAALQDMQWVLGFMSALSLREGVNSDADPVKDVDAEGIWGWLDNRCRAHPIEKIVDAAVAFYGALPRK